MPWLTIIVTLLSFFAAKKSGASTSEALGVAALAGGATYAVTHYTDWGTTTLGEYDGVTATTTDSATPSGQNVSTGTSTGLNPYIGSTLPVIAGATGAAALSSDKTLLWVGAALLALFLLK